MSQPPADLMEAIMKDPIKRALILQLLNTEKDNFEKYKRQELKTKTTPLKKVKRLHCESPTALQRRRALELRNHKGASESSSSEYSDVATEVKGPKLPFELLLKGVKAYVEVKRNNEDRSEGIKAVMKLMGATVREQFTNDVTHVIFKDGCFTTYEKAKLMKIHLVSVLWLDAVRRNNARVPEKNYPAFGNKVCNENVSVLCSQIQKDYEDVIKDERRRRHTMMTPKTSMSSYLTAHNIFASDDEGDIPQKEPVTPELTSDDSDCGVVDGHTSKRSKDSDLLKESLLLTDDASNTTKNSLESSGSPSLLSKVSSKNKRKTINVVTDMVMTPNVNSERTEAERRKVLQDSALQIGSISSLRMSMDSDKTKSGLGSSKQSEESGKKKSGKENCSVTTVGTTMSSLRLSESPTEGKKKKLTSSASKEKELNGNPPLTKDKAINTEKKSRRTENAKKTNQAPTSEEGSSKGSLKKSKRRTILEEDKIISRRSPSSTESNSGSDKSLPREESRRSGRTSVLASALIIDSINLRRSRRTSVARSISEVEIETPKKQTPIPEKKSEHAKSPPRDEIRRRRRSKSGTPTVNVRRRSRRTSVPRGIPEVERETPEKIQKAKELTKKTNKEKSPLRDENRRGSRNLTPTENLSRSRTSLARSIPEAELETPEKNQKEQIPSPAKKSRTEMKKTRKLYNPDEITAFSPVEDEKEREEYLKQKSQKSPEDVFVNPNNIHMTPLPSKQKLRNSNSDLSWSDESNKETKQKKKGKKKEKTPPRRDSASDEQTELLDLLNTSENTQKRRSERLSLSQTKPKYSGSTDGMSLSSLPITPMKRRSTLDFLPMSQTLQKRKLKVDPKRTSSIVCTKMHRAEVLNFENIVGELGRFFVEDQVTGKTTHLVCGEAKRTINMLRAIARGCWILKREWLLKSQEEKKWLNEEDYEVTDFSPAVQQCRLQREAFGPLYSMDIFKDCGYIYVGKNTVPKTSDLRELISICKGRVTAVYRNATVIIGEIFNREGVTCVTEMWVLDSIHYNKLKAFKHYLIKPASQDSPHF